MVKLSFSERLGIPVCKFTLEGLLDYIERKGTWYHMNPAFEYVCECLSEYLKGVYGTGEVEFIVGKSSKVDIRNYLSRVLVFERGFLIFYELLTNRYSSKVVSDIMIALASNEDFVIKSSGNFLGRIKRRIIKELIEDIIG